MRYGEAKQVALEMEMREIKDRVTTVQVMVGVMLLYGAAGVGLDFIHLLFRVFGEFSK
jgi:hypothetical protein